METTDQKFTEATLCAALEDVLEPGTEMYGEAYGEDEYGEYERQTSEGLVDAVATYGESGLLTGNEGLVIRMDDGTEFQVTIVQSR